VLQYGHPALLDAIRIYLAVGVFTILFVVWHDLSLDDCPASSLIVRSLLGLRTRAIADTVQAMQAPANLSLEPTSLRSSLLTVRRLSGVRQNARRWRTLFSSKPVLVDMQAFDP
jgi:hypothetical protein